MFDDDTLIVPTVLLEVVWMLQRQPNWRREEVVTALRLLMTLPRLTFADRAGVEWALERHLAGADFADMLHLALSHSATSFVTFDQRIARFADSSVVPVETLAA